MKKIGILALSGENSGGVNQYTMSMIDALACEKSNKYIIFTTNNNSLYDKLGFEVRKLSGIKNSLISKCVRNISLLFYFLKTFALSRYEKSIFSDIDVFISPTISPYPHFFAGKKYIVTIHDLQERYFPDFFPLMENIKRYIVKKAVAKHATQIICESNYVKSDIVKFLKADVNRINVIPAPPPATAKRDYSANEFEKVKSKYSLPDRYLFYPAAQFWFHKNHMGLIEAFKRVESKHKDVHLVLTGKKDEEILRKNLLDITARIKELKLENKVHILGFIDYEDMPAIYKMAEMLVMPTLFESISIPVYEAFGTGTAVCCSNVVGLPEQVGDAGLLFNPLDIEDMAEKVCTMLENNELKSNFIVSGYKKMQCNNHEKYSGQLNDVLSKVIIN
ncbi:MAG: glycosyltransferase family 4 protein [Clostridia bacterium]|nr:glycosyltransferase family 4 protein [Clostridia bacterium]